MNPFLVGTSERVGSLLLGASGLHELLQAPEKPGDPLTLTFVLGVLVFSTIYCYLIALTYRLTYEGQEYHRNLAQSLILLGVLVAMVIALIGNNVARAFGVFGALAIIRYRVPISDAKDLTIILASVVVGLACGVGQFLEAGVVTLFIVGLIVLMHWSSLGLGEPEQHKLKKWEILAKQTPQQETGITPTETADHDKHEKHHKHHMKKEGSD
jgi:ABC-type Fe3+ transport system permease subunit